jgi:hypothetical protein
VFKLFMISFIAVFGFLAFFLTEAPETTPTPRAYVHAEEVSVEVSRPEPQVAVPAKPPTKEVYRCVWAKEAPKKWRRTVDALIMRESWCDPRARGSSGELGLGQIRPKVWGSRLREAGIIRRDKDLLDPRKNIRAVVWILEQLPGGLESKLRAYNGSGPKARRYAKQLLREIGGGRG